MYKYINWAFDQPIVGAGRKFILVALADAANADGYSYPGQDSLAELTGQAKRSVRAHLEWLEEHGYVRRKERRRNDGTRTSDAYYLPPIDSTGNIRRWSTTGNIRRLQDEPENTDQDGSTTAPATGKSRRLSAPRSTGKSRTSHRQISPFDANTHSDPSSTGQTPTYQAANLAGHEPLTVSRTSSPPTPSTPPITQAKDEEKGREPTGLEDLTAYQQAQLAKPTTNIHASTLATQHRSAWAALIDFRRAQTKPPTDQLFAIWAKAALEDVRTHGEGPVIEALNVTAANANSLQTPWNYYRAIIRNANTNGQAQTTGPPDPLVTDDDLERMITLAKKGALA